MSSQSESAADASPFTQANIVGLFLTLGLCLLTQPWGSLLFRPLGRSRPWLVQFCFFLWRLNPIACVAEAVVIAICLVDTISIVWRRGYRFRLSSYAHDFHITAAALLLLRAKDDGDREARSSETQQHQKSAEAAGRLSSSLGAAVMARKERWVDLVASASIVIVMIKLAACSLPWSTSVVGLRFMVIGWLAVQALLYLVHLRELVGFGARAAAERAKQLEQLMDRPVTDWLVHLVAVPPLIYLGYAAGFAMPSTPQYLPWARPCYPFSAMASIPFHGDALSDCHYTTFAELVYLPLAVFPVAFWVSVQALMIGPVGIGLGLGAWIHAGMGQAAPEIALQVPWLLLGCSVYAAEMVDSWHIDNYSDTGKRWRAFSVRLCFMALLVAFLYFPFQVSWEGRESARSVAICLSTIVWATVILGVIRRYDGSGTFKPEWLEYLG